MELPAASSSEQSGHHCSHGVDSEGKPKKKMCCACPETKKQRDECILKNGEEKCKEFIEAHKACLRQEGFKV